ncbi:MAG: hypothetical protein ACKO5F_12925 [Synechococcus sp.]
MSHPSPRRPGRWQATSGRHRWQSSLLAAPPAGAIAALVGLASTLLPPPALAQLSPNCLRNGKPLACAITPGPEQERPPLPAAGRGRTEGQPPPPPPTTLTVMYADHRAYRLVKEEASCRQQGLVIECSATIIPGNGNGTPLRARYRGTAYEGGYRHDYSSRSVSITYFLVD